MIPGRNLLNIALTVIAKQAVLYYTATGRTANSVGQLITSFSDPVVILGSFQPVPRQMYTQYGLDFQKSYYTFYASANMIDLIRNLPTDQLGFNGKRFQLESANDWFAIDGWKGVLCVDIGLDFALPDKFGFNLKPPENTNSNFNNSDYFPSSS